MFIAAAPLYRAAMRDCEEPVGVCMCCVPIRLGIFLFTLYVMVTSLAAIAGAVSPDVGFACGGFTPWSFTAMLFFGVLGIIASIVGLIGLGDNSVAWVRSFGYLSLVRFVALMVLAWVDQNQLDSCKTLSDSHIAFSEKYSDALLRVSMSGMCTEVFTVHLILVLLDVVIYIAGIKATFKWCYAVGTCPAYHIVVGQAQPVRLYTGYGAVDGKLKDSNA
mmetsp:Transcript_66837/g.159967  ORF Transcript_66837/g.159967 Transcript_66837/m.159967 type:complete len:219 (+) Transcript_66837:88-744(+)